MKKYTVFIIQAYQEKLETQLTEVVTLELIAETEKEAINQAKSLVKKNNYRLSAVIEKYV